MMKHKIIRVLGVMGVSVLFMSSALADIAVIGNPKRTEKLDSEEVKALYLGNKTSLGSGPVKLIDQAEGSKIKEDFYQKATGKSLQDAKAAWATVVFTGAGRAPASKASDNEVVEMVSNEEAAIGYVDSSKVTSKVKVLYTVK
jgi:ABC-type phosphate transport system substrate-binding protein